MSMILSVTVIDKLVGISVWGLYDMYVHIKTHGRHMLTIYIYFRLVHVAVQIADNFVSPLLDAVLLDYQRNVASAREPEVLSTMAVIIDKLDVSHYLCSFF